MRLLRFLTMSQQPQRLLAYKYATCCWTKWTREMEVALVGVLPRFLKVKYSLPDLKPWGNMSLKALPNFISGLDCIRQHMGSRFSCFVWAYTGYCLLAVLLLSSHFNFFFFHFILSLLPFINLDTIFLKGESDTENKQLCLAKGVENSI